MGRERMNKVTKNLHWILFAILFMFSITLVHVGTASSSEMKIAVDPPEVKDLEPGETFTVDIIVTDIVVGEIGNGLYAWDVKLKFDSAVLNVVEITEGPFLKTVFNETAWEQGLMPPKIDNSTSMITMGNVHMPVFPIPVPGATGNGTLATVTFEVVSHGKIPLHFELSILHTYLPPDIRYEMEHTAVDGSFDNGTAIELSIELIVAIIVVITVCCAGAFLYIKRRRA